MAGDLTAFMDGGGSGQKCSRSSGNSCGTGGFFFWVFKGDVVLVFVDQHVVISIFQSDRYRRPSICVEKNPKDSQFQVKDSQRFLKILCSNLKENLGESPRISENP